MATAYPNTRLSDDVLDPDYGGQPASAFGQPAFSWLNSVLRFLGKAYLVYNRAPYATAVVPCATGCTPGQVAVLDAGAFAANSAPYVRPYTSGLVAPRLVGVWLEGASAGALARVAVSGIVPAAIVGLGTFGAATDAGANPTTGLLRAAIAGDTILGTLDLQGNLLLSTPGVAI